MEVLVLIDFEGIMGDEMTVRTGDVVKKVTKANEEGWLEGELNGKRGIFPANFVKEVPVFLIGDLKREPRSFRTSKMKKPTRKCEVAFAYSRQNEDELELAAGETIEILREIEDGWWMGRKGGQVGAFPSNFVKEVFVTPKECCQVMFDYTALTEDELDLKKGQLVLIINKETEDDGWWEGELNGRHGFFPDNFVMLIPPVQSAATSTPPARQGSQRHSVKTEPAAMEMGGPTKTKDEKPESTDLRSNPPVKVKLPCISKPSPPPVKEKPNKVLPKCNGSSAPPSPKPSEETGSGQFEQVDVSTEKLSHPTANRAKPPQRRPPSGLVATAQAQSGTDQTDSESSPKNSQGEKMPDLPKIAENLTPSPAKPNPLPNTSAPSRPPPPKVVVDATAGMRAEEPSLDGLQAEIRELRMSLQLLQTQHEQDIKEVKEELRQERTKRMALQEQVDSLSMKH
ncbi:SH3 domain-containing protein 21 isoform X2 [Lampris incognitus]|uniref:SH3 domain-containing protein 21 isoform X2 n=1 Tax=Lampris incognitus TaxID=2546036 RepID=UPI0024B5D876|nr:SH3 domain-containing protein 21 isoform X2 [Lampris incognitus]